MREDVWWSVRDKILGGEMALASLELLLLGNNPRQQNGTGREQGISRGLKL